MTTTLTNARPQRIAVLLLALAGLWRLFFYAQGGAFIARPLNFALQYLDPVLLREDLCRSILYLHSQPPLFNLMLGLVLKASPDPALSYWILFTTMGMLIPLLLYDCLSSVGVPYWVAAGATVVFMFNPTLLLYEHLLYYTHIETFLVLLAVYSFARWCCHDSTPALGIFCGSLACLGLVRSLYHPIFFVVLILFLAGYAYGRLQDTSRARRLLCFGFGIVLVPLAVLCAKNYAFYGFIGTSSWDGLSLWNKVNGYDAEELDALYARGIVSSRAVEADHEPFKPIDRYPGLAENVRCHHPADCAVWKSTGKPNFNHCGYVELSRALRADAWALIRHDPARFALYTAGSYSLTLWYSSDSVHALFEKNREVLEPIEKIYRYLWFGFLGVRNRHSDSKIWLYAGCVSALYLLLYSVGLGTAFFTKKHQSALGLLCILCCVFHSFTLIVSSLVEFGENNRFRFPVDVSLLVLAAALFVLERTARRSKNHTHSGEV